MRGRDGRASLAERGRQVTALPAGPDLDRMVAERVILDGSLFAHAALALHLNLARALVEHEAETQRQLRTWGLPRRAALNAVGA